MKHKNVRKVGYGGVVKAVTKVASVASSFIPGANVLSAIGLGAQIFSGMQERKYAGRAADASQRQFELQKQKAEQESRYQEVLAQRQRAATFREQRIRTGNIVAATGGTGLGMAGTSSFTGSVGSLGTQAATGVGNINVAESTGQTLSNINQQIGGAASEQFTAQSNQQGWRQISTMASNFPTSFGNIFKTTPTTTEG
ncbi:hypothetical protein UFOVP454_35 [uncultured Caudovirales phage]|uniref:Internal virion protein n=1 Tax=uncultured Caudovirales phage TaxID=2100421 RepID=A0A6J5MBL9_9CAUD|nr:hypothetical protein UFOVP454_35 [uncultured Caudovirales phage]